MSFTIEELAMMAMDEGVSLKEVLKPLVDRLNPTLAAEVRADLRKHLPDLDYYVTIEVTVSLGSEDIEGDRPTHEEIVRKVAQEFDEATDYTTEEWFAHHIQDWAEA